MNMRIGLPANEIDGGIEPICLEWLSGLCRHSFFGFVLVCGCVKGVGWWAVVVLCTRGDIKIEGSCLFSNTGV